MHSIAIYDQIDACKGKKNSAKREESQLWHAYEMESDKDKLSLVEESTVGIIQAQRAGTINYDAKNTLNLPLSQNYTETLSPAQKSPDGGSRVVLDMELIRDRYNQDLGMRKMDFLISMISEESMSEQDEQVLLRLAREYSLRLSGECFLLFAVNLDILSAANPNISLSDLESKKAAIANTTHNITAKYLRGEIFTCGSTLVGILSDSAESISAYSDLLIREVHRDIRYLYGSNATIGVSYLFHSITQLRNAFLSARSALYYHVDPEEGGVVYPSDMEIDQKFIPVFDDSWDMQFTSILKTGNKQELVGLIDEIFLELTDRKAGPKAYHICLIEMYTTALRVHRSVSDTQGGTSGDLSLQDDFFGQGSAKQRKWLVNLGQTVCDDLSFQENLFGQSPAKQREWLINLCHKVMDKIHNQQKSSASILGEEGYDYLRKNYADPSISLKTVSQYLHISASYFSAVFKKETGQSFTDALIKIRMKAAKELLLTTQYKIFEIAAKTGYTDQHYFSYSYKKYFGQSPNDMRAAHGIVQTNCYMSFKQP